jgi:hypothetical protein
MQTTSRLIVSSLTYHLQHFQLTKYLVHVEWNWAWTITYQDNESYPQREALCHPATRFTNLTKFLIHNSSNFSPLARQRSCLRGPRKIYLTLPPPTLLNFRKSQLTHDMNDNNWHEWHELTWICMNDIKCHEWHDIVTRVNQNDPTLTPFP